MLLAGQGVHLAHLGKAESEIMITRERAENSCGVNDKCPLIRVDYLLAIHLRAI
jgi:hypothetical protein